jgi:2,5-diketo-D-gluconate reductase B
MHHVQAGDTRIPVIGLGTWQLRGQDCREAVRHALSIGYRHIDTARLYDNETAVGAGLRDSGVDRDEVFLVTKVPGRRADRNGVAEEVEASLRELGVDHIDLLLLHQPGEVAIEETMAAFRAQQDAERVRHLGVSNFSVAQLDQASAEAPIVTVQNEYHPGRDQDDVLAWCRDHDAALTAYSPLGKGSEVGDDTLTEIGRHHAKTSAQVAIRWLLQQDGVVTIPRSGDPTHREQNLDVFDFELTDDEMARIAANA